MKEANNYLEDEQANTNSVNDIINAFSQALYATDTELEDQVDGTSDYNPADEDEY